MLSLSSLIEFLLDMLRDDATQAEFERDPSATLAARGLADVTAQDIRDVQPMLADVGGVQRVSHDGGGHGGGGHSGGHSGGHFGGHSGGHSGHAEVVREIHHVTHEYEVVRPSVEVTQEFRTYNSFSEFHTTDNSIHATDGSTVVSNSFNQDNDGVDNKGGVIDDSTVGGQDVVDSGNTTEQTEISDSFDDDHSTQVDDSFNESVQQEWDDVGNDGAPDGDDVQAPVAPEPYADSSYAGSSYSADTVNADTVNGSYAVDAPAASVAVDLDEPVGEHG